MNLYKSTYTVEKIFTYGDQDNIEAHIAEMEHKNYKVVPAPVLPLFLQKPDIVVYTKTIEEYGPVVKAEIK